MSDQRATLTIVIDDPAAEKAAAAPPASRPADNSRHNPDLDAAMGFGPAPASRPPGPAGPPPPPDDAGGPPGRARPRTMDWRTQAPPLPLREQRRTRTVGARRGDRRALIRAAGRRGIRAGQMIGRHAPGAAAFGASMVGAAASGRPGKVLGTLAAGASKVLGGVGRAAGGIVGGMVGGPGGAMIGGALGEAIGKNVLGPLVWFGKEVANIAEMVKKRSQELARYSPEIAGSLARAQVREIRSDVRDAQELGPAMGRINDAWSQTLEDIRDMLRPLTKWALEIFAGLIETIANWVRGARDFTSNLGTTISASFEAALKASEKKLDEANAILKGIPKRIEDERRKRDKVAVGLEQFFALADRAVGQLGDKGGGLQAELDALRRQRDQALALPMFSGV